MIKRIKRIVVTFLIILLSVGFLPGRLVWADTGTTSTTDTSTQTVDPTPMPTPSPSGSPAPSPDPTPSPTPATETLSVDPSPTPSPDPSPSPTPCPSGCATGDVTQQNQAAVNNNVAATSDTGGNTSGTPSDTQGYQATQSATVEDSGSAGVSDQGNGGGSNVATGNATTNVNVVNQVNTNLVNSDYSYSVKNLYLDQNGNIDLSALGSSEELPSALVVVKDSNNATVVNLIYASANSGQNTINGTGSVDTGNAYVSANLLNFINTNFVNSTFHLVIFNIFGTLSGNIVLPDNFGQTASTSGTQSQNGGQGSQVSQQNSADITNSVQATSNTGQNGASGGGQIQTGDATTAVNVLSLANFNIFGGSFAKLLINNFGNWNGQFLGWGTAGPSDPIYGLMAFDFGSLGSQSGGCGCTDGSMTNTASVDNQVTATANTGGNNISGGRIITGSAFAAVNIFNFINANIINTKGFFGIINIFGTLNGDIGGASNFPQPTPDPGADSASTNQPDVHGPGGALSSSVSTNVGSHVNPGDTVTFFGTARNTGTGPVYDSKVTFNLYDPNGNLASVQTFNLGKLDAGRVAKITFGLVLAGTAPAGTYNVVLEAQGKVGTDDSAISSSSNAGFQVGLPLLTFAAGGSLAPDVLAASTIGDGGGGQGAALASDVASSYNWLEVVFMLLGYMGMLYIAQRLLVRPYRIAIYYLGRRRQWQWPQVRGRAVFFKMLSRFASGAMALRHFLF